MSSDIPFYNDHPTLKPCEFLGFGMLQNRLSVPAWSYAFEILHPKTVIELGTYEGSFSIPLAIGCRNIGARFVTFDRNAFCDKWKWWFWVLDIDFRLRPDILSSDCVQEIKGLIGSKGTSIVLCDGGDKKKEFSVMSEFLKSGDVIAAHDFMDPGTKFWKSCEVTSKDVEKACQDWNLEPWNQEIFERAAWLVRRKL